MVEIEKCRGLIDRISSELSLSHPGLLADFPLEKYIRFLHEYPEIVSHVYVSREIKNYCATIVKAAGAGALEAYHKLVLLTLIIEAPDRLKTRKLTDEIRELYDINFTRIIRQIEINGEPPGFYQYSDDGFRKDIALGNLILIPVGGYKIDLAHFPLKVMYTEGWQGLSRCLRLTRAEFGIFDQVFPLRHFYPAPKKIFRDLNALAHLPFEFAGFLPLYDVHFDPHDPHLMSQKWGEEYVRTLIRIADLLKVQTRIGGLYGTSWMNDPEVMKINPRYQFNRDTWLGNGAELFYLGMNEETTRNAIATSPTRRRLYLEGRYTPKNYIRIWPRERLIRWADARRKQLVDNSLS